MYLDIGFCKSLKLSGSEASQMITHAMLYIKDYMMIPGQVENFNLVIDSGKIGMTSFPTKLLKACLGELKKGFRGFAHKIFIVNTSGSIGFLWKMIEPMIPKHTRQKT